MLRWVPVVLLVGLIAVAFVSTDWVPLLAVFLIAVIYLGYEYISKR
jgi:energy-coupling factor transporter transmembrane protein EcfT